MNLIQPIKIVIAVVILVFAFGPIIPVENDIVVEEPKVAKIVAKLVNKIVYNSILIFNFLLLHFLHLFI